MDPPVKVVANYFKQLLIVTIIGAYLLTDHVHCSSNAFANKHHAYNKAWILSDYKNKVMRVNFNKVLPYSLKFLRLSDFSFKKKFS